MGRLTLHMLLSFTQFEREVTAERIRDKVAASKRKGLWMGGRVPLGYEKDGRTLRINGSMCGPGLDPGLRPGAWHPVAGPCFPCAYGEPESPTSPPTRLRSGARHGSMTIETARRASLEFVCVFGQDGQAKQGRLVRLVRRIDMC